MKGGTLLPTLTSSSHYILECSTHVQTSGTQTATNICIFEHHTLEVKMMSREDGTLFWRDGTVLKRHATTLALKKCNIAARRSAMPVCMGASLQEITCSQFVVAESNNLELEYNSQNDNWLELVYIKDVQYWTFWMEPGSP